MKGTKVRNIKRKKTQKQNKQTTTRTKTKRRRKKWRRKKKAFRKEYAMWCQKKSHYSQEVVVRKLQLLLFCAIAARSPATEH